MPCIKAISTNNRQHLSGIVGSISSKTWGAMNTFLASTATEEFESMALALIDMGATGKNVDAKAFAGDLKKIFSSVKASITALQSFAIDIL